MIDIEKLREKICDNCLYVNIYKTEESLHENQCRKCRLMKMLDEMESIVYCKECIHWKHDVPSCNSYVGHCEFAGWMVGENGFCVYANMRKEEYQPFEG